MKAVVYEEYGSPDMIQIKEVKRPAPKEKEVLVRVHAASVNSWDYDLLRGKPYVFRFWGFFKPKFQILGADVAGRVETVGTNVRQFKPGDEVFGDLCQCGWGGFAEYVCAREDALALKSPGMTFEEAAAVPQAGVMALQGIRDYGQVQAGQQVLINGGGGGVGTFAIQIAKHFGAEVTGVDNKKKLDLMKSIGADHVIDFTQENFTRNKGEYDLILDVAAHHSLFDYKRVLRPGGKYIMVGGATPRIFQLFFLWPWFSMTRRMSRNKRAKTLGILAHKPNKDLPYLSQLVDSGGIKPVIDRRYTLEEVPEAFRYFGDGNVLGKIVITVGQKHGT